MQPWRLNKDTKQEIQIFGQNFRYQLNFQWSKLKSTSTDLTKALFCYKKNCSSLNVLHFAFYQKKNMAVNARTIVTGEREQRSRFKVHHWFEIRLKIQRNMSWLFEILLLTCCTSFTGWMTHHRAAMFNITRLELKQVKSIYNILDSSFPIPLIRSKVQ